MEEYIKREAVLKILDLEPDYWYKGRTVQAGIDAIPRRRCGGA